MKKDIDEIKEYVRAIDRNWDEFRKEEERKNKSVFDFKEEGHKLAFVLCSFLMLIILVIAFMIFLYNLFG